MANSKIICRLNFHYLSVALFKLFFAAVKNGIYNNPATFMAPTISVATLEAHIENYNTTYTKFKNRTGTKADFLLAKTALMNALDTLAVYVNGVAENNPEIIMLAGYTPTKGVNSNVTTPVQPVGVVITRGIPGELETDCTPVATVESYGAIMVADNPLPANIRMNGLGQLEVIDDDINPALAITGTSAEPGVPVIKALMDLNKSRKKKFINLAIGTTYYVYYWAINAGGVSPLSEVVSKKVLEP